MRLRLAATCLALLAAACGPEVRERALVPSLPAGCSPRFPINTLQVTALGDFPPASQNVAAAGDDGSGRLRLPKGTRVVLVEGKGQNGLAAFGRTAPGDLDVPTGDTIPVVFGPPDGICRTGGLNYTRSGHRATRLSSGNVLISGGVDAQEFPVPRMEIYAPAGDLLTGPSTFRVVDAGGATVIESRAALGHAVAPLPDGGALVTGGAPVDRGLASGIASQGYLRLRADGIADGAPGLLLGGPRAFHSATALADGRVVLAGGCASLKTGGCDAGLVLSSTEVYDPRTGRFTPGPGLRRVRYGHTAVRRGDDSLLLVGGRDEAGNEPPIEVLDPNESRGFDLTSVAGTAAALPTGAVALVGGRAQPTQVALLGTLADPPFGLAPLGQSRTGHSVTALEDGAFLVAGGAVGARLVVYDSRGRASTLGAFARSDHTATLLADGTVLLAGGRDAGGQATTQADVFLRSAQGPYSSPAVITFDGEAEPWVTPRPDRALATGGVLRVSAPRAGEGGRPGELALVSAIDVDQMTLTVSAGLDGAGSAAVLVLGWRSEASFAFVTLEPDQPVSLKRVDPVRAGLSAVSDVAGCTGELLSASELHGGSLEPIILSWRLGVFEVGNPTRSLLRCNPEAGVPRGGVGVGALRGTALFDNLQVVR